MSLKEQQTQALETMAQHEETIGRLYKVYSSRLPSYAEFWSSLSEAEEEHARTLRGLRAGIEDGTVFFQEGRFHIAAIKSSLGYVRERLAEAEKKDVSAPEALSVALEIEKSFIDGKAFAFFESDSPKLRQVLLSLAESTSEHVRIVQSAWDRIRKPIY